MADEKVVARGVKWHSSGLLKVALTNFGVTVWAITNGVLSRLPQDANIHQLGAFFNAMYLSEWFNLVVAGIVCLWCVFFNDASVEAPKFKRA